MTDKQRIRKLEGALKAARAALLPMTSGTYWINRPQVAKAKKAIERADAVLCVTSEGREP
jgi:hypothetical protein